jgi:hypothetical protein
MRQRWLTTTLIAVLLLAALCLVLQLAAPLPRQAHAEENRSAQTSEPDAYEPDGPGSGDPPWIGDGESQNRSFFPDDDIDRARLYVKAGHWYDVHTSGLGNLVDTFLEIEAGGTLYQDDDGGPEPLTSRIYFQAAVDAQAIITITNRQAVYSPEQIYKLTAGEAEAPTPTPTSTPRPTSPPPPTATPPQPIVNFSAEPGTLQKPGDCTTLHWSVDRASEVFLVLPNGNQEGVEGLGQRQVCPVETSEYLLKVNAPGGNETVRVVVSVPLPTPTPSPTPKPQAGSNSNPASANPKGKATLHVIVFVDENYNGIYDPDEGVGGAIVLLRSEANPAQVLTQLTDDQGQAHFDKTAAGSYAVLIPHLGRAETVNTRGEEATIDVLLPALRLPARIP